MTLRVFIKEHRNEIDEVVNEIRGRVPRTASCYCSQSGKDHTHEQAKLNDDERREWVLSDEGLYRWARSEGVSI